MRYRAEAFRVLWRAVQAETLSVVGAVDRSQTTTGRSLAQIRELELALAHMAEQQMALELRVGEHDGRLDRAAMVSKDIERRLTRGEARTAEAAVISDAQAAELANRVRAIAKALTAHDPSTNHDQGGFGKLYRRFRVSTYKHMRQEQYAAVLALLDAWSSAIHGSKPTPPSNDLT